MGMVVGPLKPLMKDAVQHNDTFCQTNHAHIQVHVGVQFCMS